jgi:uncharacterized membrane protein
MASRSGLVGLTSVAWLLMAPVAAAQQTAPPPETGSEAVWWRAFYKTMTYETAANTADMLLLGALTGSVGALGGAFLAANTATAAVTYYTHEIAWTFLGPPPEDRTAMTSVSKALTYRAASTGRSYVLARFFVADPGVATAFAIIGNVSDTIIYLTNEWAWNTLAAPVRP